MKRIALLLATIWMLSGCTGEDELMEQALSLRSRVLGAQGCTFEAELTADYIDSVEEFSLHCSVDPEGVVSFRVKEPEVISGVTGQVSGEEGALTFEDQVLAFPLMAEERLSPVSAPWILMKALRSGFIRTLAEEDGLLHLTVDDSYSDDALTVDIWVRDNVVVAGEISWQGRRAVSMVIEDFALV